MSISDSLSAYRAPLRVSLAGGGTDHASHYSKHGGLSVGFAITCGVEVAPRSTGSDVDPSMGWLSVDRKDPLVVAARAHYGIPNDAEFVSKSDVGRSGTGLAASAAFLLALQAGAGQRIVDRQTAAEMAHYVEDVLANRFAGKQDPYLSAYGGLQAVHIDTAGNVSMEALEVSDELRQYFAHQVLLFDSGVKRPVGFMASDSNILATKESDAAVMERTHAIASEMVVAIRRSEFDRIGPLVAEHWDAKQARSGVRTPAEVLRIIQSAKQFGADGYKLIGAGGGGYLLLMAPVDRIQSVRSGMMQEGLSELRFEIQMHGVSVANKLAHQ